jgi:hypothetical protein
MYVPDPAGVHLRDIRNIYRKRDPHCRTAVQIQSIRLNKVPCFLRAGLCAHEASLIGGSKAQQYAHCFKPGQLVSTGLIAPH